MKKFVLVLVALCLVTVTAQAKTRFDVENSKLKLPPPPEAGSAAEKRDFEILFKYQNERTDEDCAIAKSQSRMPAMTVFYGRKSGVLTEEEFDRVEDLGNELIQAVGRETQPFKKRYQRLRPYDANEDLHPCVYLPGGQTSYPSGHAAAAVVTAGVLAKIYPHKAEKILKAGFMIGEYRVLGGVHHPSDVIAGRELGKQILRELAKQEEFREAVEALQ